MIDVREGEESNLADVEDRISRALVIYLALNACQAGFSAARIRSALGEGDRWLDVFGNEFIDEIIPCNCPRLCIIRDKKKKKKTKKMMKMKRRETRYATQTSITVQTFFLFGLRKYVFIQFLPLTSISPRYSNVYLSLSSSATFSGT